MTSMPMTAIRNQASMTMPLFENSIKNLDLAAGRAGSLDNHAALSSSPARVNGAMGARALPGAVDDLSRA